MNEKMWLNPALQDNVIKLKNYGTFFFVGPSTGNLACGTEGEGRLEDEYKIIDSLTDLLKLSDDLKGKNVLVTAGGTKERIDSVRYVSNYSSGKMGYNLAMEAKFRCADRVVLISASSGIPKIFGGQTYYVENTQQMKEKVMQYFEDSDVIIMAAAVSDIIPEKRYDYKLKKSKDLLSKIKFIENENILKILSDNKKDSQILCGFAAESGENMEYGIEKLKGNKIDLIVVNDISRNDIGFESDYNEVFIIDRQRNVRKIPKTRKRIISREIINEIVRKLS